MVILSVISLGYRAFADNRCVALALGGMQAGVARGRAGRGVRPRRTVLRERSPLHIAVMAAAFIAGALLGANVVYVILAAALAGVGHALLRRRARGARPMTLLKLFWSFLQVGLFSIGGGYAAMPLR